MDMNTMMKINAGIHPGPSEGTGGHTTHDVHIGESSFTKHAILVGGTLVWLMKVHPDDLGLLVGAALTDTIKNVIVIQRQFVTTVWLSNDTLVQA